MKNYILSVYFGYHDSCITIADSQQILLHLEAERVFRKKHIRVDANQMILLIQEGLNYLHLNIDDFGVLLIARWNNQFEESRVNILRKTFKPILTSHHQNHIGTAYASGYDNALVIVADGGSEDGTTKIYSKKGATIELLEDLDNTILTGKFYGTVTQIIVEPHFIKAHAFSPGKTMGLAALGSFSHTYHKLLKKCSKEFNSLHEEGCKRLNKIFGISNHYQNYWRDQGRRNLAYTAQKFWQEEFAQKIFSYVGKYENVILTGGCFLNVLLNSAIVESNKFHNVFISPVSGDNGQSLGAILYHFPHIRCTYPYLGRGFGEIDTSKYSIGQIIADLLDHKVVAWYQGRSEIGARALGHRSFLGIADSLFMKKRLSEEIKGREPYRPVAAVVPEEDVSKFFETRYLSPFMTYAPKARENIIKNLPAIVHYDNTTRIQTLSLRENPILYKILKEIGKRTGFSILMNSSFNTSGEPMVDTPEDAMRSFYKSGADVLYINGVRYE